MFWSTKWLILLAVIAGITVSVLPTTANTYWNSADAITYRTQYSPSNQFSCWAYGIEDGSATASFQQAGGNSVLHNGHAITMNGRYDFGLPGYTRILGLVTFSIDDSNGPRYFGYTRNPWIGSQFVFYLANTGDAYAGPPEIASMPLEIYPSSVTENYHVVDKAWLISLLNLPYPPSRGGSAGTAEAYHQSAALRWTAPATNNYDITATWTGRKLTGSETVPVQLYANGTQFSADVPVLDGSAPVVWNGTVYLTQGQTVDSMILPGTNGDDYLQVDLVVKVATAPPPNAYVSGTVTGNLGASHPPIVGATISVVGGVSQTTTDSGGQYILALPAGTYHLRASATKYEDADLTNIVLTTGNTSSNNNFDLTTSYIKGKVTANGPGSPALAGANVQTVLPDNSLESVTTDTGGNYTLLVAHGTYTVKAHQVGYSQGVAAVAVGVNSTATQDFQLTPGWDFATDFTTAGGTPYVAGQLPNGPWSYAYENSTATTVYNALDWIGNILTSGVGDMTWYTRSAPNNYSFESPAFIKNGGTTAIQSPLGVDYIAGIVYSKNVNREAGKVVTSSRGLSNMSSVGRFVVPTSGYYKITARWAGEAYGGTTGYQNTNVGLRYNGTYIFGGPGPDPAPEVLSGYAGSAANAYSDSTGSNPVVTYSDNWDLSTGDVIDTVVSYPSTWCQTDLSFTPGDGISYISGRVTAGNLPGNPAVPNATVTAKMVPATYGPYPTVTDANGNFLIGVRPGSYNLEAKASGYNTVTYPISVPTSTTIIQDASLTHSGTWNLANDFNYVANPNGQWSYGYTTGTIPYNNSWGADYLAPLVLWNTQTPVWCSPQSMAVWCTGDMLHGWLGKNTSGGPVSIVGSGGVGYIDNNTMSFGGGGTNSTEPRIRWTSPDQRTVKVNFTVTAQTPAGFTASVTLARNGSTFMATKTANGFVGTATNGFADSIGPAPTATYEAQVLVNSGDTLDFMLGKDSNGLWSGFYGYNPKSMGISATISPGSGTVCSTIAQLKAVPDGVGVFMTTPLILGCNTDQFLDYSFYMQTADRSQAIKCIGSDSLPVCVQGTRVTVSGKMATDAAGQRVILVQSFMSMTAGAAPMPVGPGSKGLTSTMRPLNMLVKVWGRLKERNPVDIGPGPFGPPDNSNVRPWNYWTLSDGNQDIKIPMNVQNDWMCPPFIPSWWPLNDYIAVTGIATLDNTGQVVVLPMRDTAIVDYSQF